MHPRIAAFPFYGAVIMMSMRTCIRRSIKMSMRER